MINRTAAPKIFADDTSILFAHSNMRDFNRNIHIIFVNLNKWFKAKQLPIYFSKTNYIQFTTKRNMSCIYISRPTRCTNSYNEFLLNIKCSTCFGLFSPSSGAMFWSCISQLV